MHGQLESVLQAVKVVGRPAVELARQRAPANLLDTAIIKERLTALAGRTPLPIENLGELRIGRLVAGDELGERC